VLLLARVVVARPLFFWADLDVAFLTNLDGAALDNAGLVEEPDERDVFRTGVLPAFFTSSSRDVLRAFIGNHLTSEDVP